MSLLTFPIKLSRTAAQPASLALVAALGGMAAMAPTQARAQATNSLERYAPPVVRVDGGGHVLTTQSGVERSVADRDKVLARKLVGVVFVDKPKAVRKKGLKSVGVSAKTAPGSVPDSVIDTAKGFVDQPVTLGLLDDLARALVKAYRSADRPVVNVVVPEQDITNGVLQILVVVGRLDKVRVEGATGEEAAALAREIMIAPGAPISEGQVQEDLRFLNRSPFRHVDALYQPGKNYSQTDLVLQNAESKPWTVYAGATSNGSTGPVGSWRPDVGAMEYGQLGLGETLGYQYTTDPSFNKLHSQAVSLTLPMMARWQFQAIVGTTTTHVPVQNGVLNQTGSSTMAGGYFTVPLPRYFENWANDFRFGAEYKVTNNNLDYSGSTVVAGRPEIYQGVVGYAGEGVVWGTNLKLSVDVNLSPGGIGASNMNTPFQTLRGGAAAQYAYVKTHLDDRWDMVDGWRLLSSVTGQYATTNLLPTEELTLGGIGSVRGFQPQLALTDSGVIGNFTLYSPGVTVARTLSGDNEAWLDQLRAYVFVDHGSGYDHKALTGQARYVGLTGSGLGLSYEASRYLNIDVGYGWHIQETGVVNDRDHGVWHFQAVARY